MSKYRARAAVAAALTAAGFAAAIPAVADAAVASNFDAGTNVLTITSDGASDAITVTVNAAAGVYAINGTDTTVIPDPNVGFVVNAGAGNDTVDFRALQAGQFGDLVVNGGEGDDLLFGGVRSDVLNGDGGNDRIVGFKNPPGTTDRLNGDDGNDTLVWDNGDGSDLADGGNGADTVEVNGAATAGDVFTIQPGAVAGRVRLDRTNLGQFFVDLSAERLEVNGLGGDDTASGTAGLAGLLPGGLELNGGAGNDTLRGGDGADLITGGDGNDTLDGAGGGDRLVGGRGTDTVNGGDGDDALVWNNGDGNDVNNGGDGADKSEVNGALGAGDTFTVVPNGNRARLDRTNLVPFNVDLDTEILEVNGFGGDDALTVSPGLAGRLQVIADGGAGNDMLTGAEEADSFFGGEGSDILTGGGGPDELDGQGGNDQLLARDDTGDLVRGGGGEDAAQVDGVDVVDGVESVDRANPVVIVRPELRLGRATIVRRGRALRLRIPVTCSGGGCDATITVTTAGKVRLGAARLRAVLGGRTVSLTGDRTHVVSVPLASSASSLARRGRLGIRIEGITRDASQNVATATTGPQKLRVPRRR